MRRMCDFAVRYAGLGLKVFPAVPGERRACIKDYAGHATSDLAEIAEFWRRFPDAEVGALTGTGGDLVVLDIDRAGPDHAHDGLAKLKENWRRLGFFPETAVAITPGGGLHYYFRPAGEVKNATLWPGADLIAWRKCVRLPPGTKAGRPYRWARDPLAWGIADLPKWIAPLAALKAAPPIRAKTLKPFRPDQDAEPALRHAVATVRSAPPGQRNNTLHREAVFLRHVVDEGRVDPDTAVRALVTAAVDGGLPEPEARQTAERTIKGSGAP